MTEQIEGYELVGTGLNVVPVGRAEGTAKNAETPGDIMKLMANPAEMKETVLVTPTGAATFVGPVLGMGIRGVITYVGTAECHLGIVGREFRLPIILGLELAEGADLIADGTVVLMDCSEPRLGKVYAKVKK